MKKILSVKTAFPASFTTLAIIFSLLSIDIISPQIIIEERIEINNSTAKNNPGMNPSTVYTDSGFIMWKSGYLQVDYNSHFSYLYHYDGPMPAYSSLNTYFLKDNSLKIDPLLPRFPQLTVSTHNFYDYCNSGYFPRTRYFYDRQSPGIYNIGYVEEGDTVRFSYYSDIVGSGMPYTYVITDASEYSEGWVFDVYQVDSCFRMGVNGFSILVNIVVLNTLDHFEVTIVPDTLALFDTLAFAETARLIIQAKDADSNDVNLPLDKLLTFEVRTNENYGTFIDANSDTLKTTPAVLDNITYGDANAGLIKFAAVKENPDSFVTCRVKVYLQEDTTKNGEREAVVLEQTLKIEMEEPYAVRPTYFNSEGVRVYAEHYSQKTFDVKMTRGGEPVVRHHFKLYTDYVDGSGGHDHTNQRPDNNNNYGFFLKPNDNEHYRPLEDSTSLLGRFDNVIYNASYFGDVMRIYLISTQNKLFIDSIDIIERIPNLVELGEGNNYELVGAPQNHSGTNNPCRPTPPISQHNINHFGTQEIITAVQNIANDYAELHPGIRIRVNDMSLEHGGLFDGNDFNNWLPPHQSHRMGTNADISYRGIDESDTCIDLNLRDLRIIIDERCVTDPYPESNHYHIYE